MATFPQSNGSHGSEDCWADNSHSFYYWSQAGSGKVYLMPGICLLPSRGWRKTGGVNGTARMTMREWCLFWTFSCLPSFPACLMNRPLQRSLPPGSLPDTLIWGDISLLSSDSTEKSAFCHFSEYCLVLFLGFVPGTGQIPLLNPKFHYNIGCTIFVVDIVLFLFLTTHSMLHVAGLMLRSYLINNYWN